VTTLDLVARLILAVVFAVSGFTKLTDRAGTRQAATDFGVPSALVPALATALAPLELAIAVGLLARGPVATAAAALASVLLVGFTVAIVSSLVRDRRVACHCFGSTSDQPVTWWSVARNVALLTLAGVVLAEGTAQPWPWEGVTRVVDSLDPQSRWLWGVVVVLATAVALLAVLFWSLLRRYGEVLHRLDALEVSNRAEDHHGHDVFQSFPLPSVKVTDDQGVVRDVAQTVAAQGSSLMVFVSPSCLACGELADELRAWQLADDDLPIVVLSPGSATEVAAKFGDLRVHRLADAAQTDAFRMEYTPGAFVVENGQIVSPPSFGADDMRALHAGLTGRPAPVDVALERAPLRQGDTLPDVVVATPEGEMSLAAAVHAVDDDAVVLLWDTTCGFCQQIEADVAQLAREASVLVALRDRDLGRLHASGLTAPVALDVGFAAGDALGSPGTPSAVRVRGGRLASSLAVGGPEVLGLLRAAAAVTESV
jgi:hypothetical protein